MLDCPMLSALDGLHGLGILLVPEKFIEKHVEYVVCQQQADGGFPGRRGASDTYYTDFAARVLSLVPSDTWAHRAAKYMEQLGDPADVIDCFNRLNIARLLGKRGLEAGVDLAGIRAALDRQRLPSGAFARKGSTHPSAYHTFLGLLCLQMLGEHAPDVTAAIANLHRSDGGYGDMPADAAGQTSPTAAAVFIHFASSRIDSRAMQFLTSMQAPDGGFRAHPDAPCGDLLSTFNVLTTLGMLFALDGIDLAAAARFLKSMAVRGGGFRSCAADSEPDIEYTYYGIGSVATLAVYAASRKLEEN